MSDTPIYDALWLERESWDRLNPFVPGFDPRFDAEQFKRERLGEWKSDEETVSVEILPDTTKFRELMRVGGRRNGRSAELDRLVARVLYGASETPIYDQMRREQYSESVINMFAAFNQIGESVRWAHARLLLGLNHPALVPSREYSDEAHKLSRVTGWSLEDSEDVLRRIDTTSTRPFSMQGLKPYIAVVDELSVRSRSLAAQQNKSYPTSSPSWARKKKR